MMKLLNLLFIMNYFKTNLFIKKKNYEKFIEVSLDFSFYNPVNS